MFTCSIHRVWETARDQLRETLGQTDFQSMLADRSCTTDLLQADSPDNSIKHEF